MQENRMQVGTSVCSERDFMRYPMASLRSQKLFFLRFGSQDSVSETEAHSCQAFAVSSTRASPCSPGSFKLQGSCKGRTLHLRGVLGRKS